ncbi:Flp pilus assembly complex ATPase component TadA [Clostridium botulinum C]|uniref:Type II secretion system protein GspE n=2 Tax=Clostridium botulinum TaxID=1491 RepID=A0A9Q4TEF5_CLOBO|nr:MULTISPECIES: GspE/PulE family protein [Clostridium]EGO88101.1 type II secretion system protein E [Clostridium botulinum C str. Stockholm]KEI06483.1 type II secretion system protein E [Clostridium sp. K25]MCD3193779.1 Flp pilus assembly complex ATPase component TadA [Clostridium botulinum C]MCD3199847.1 Flp pilus assembly complex ATPase component TadA [Clostridium botulinum C]MCD3205322.1 Flp pilus assembly complex ATPase component TadA [Clostridium botulinum C]
MSKTYKRLGDILLSIGKINEKQLNLALSIQQRNKKKLGEIFIEEGIVTEEEIVNVLKEQLGIPKVELEMIYIDRKAILSVPASIAKKYTLIPIGFSHGKISVVMWDPLNIFAIDDVKIATNLQVEVLLATRSEINKAIEKYYSDQYVNEAAEELYNEKNETEVDKFNVSFDNDLKSAPAVKMVDYLFKSAIESRASDIHIEPYEDIVRIRYRIDGVLHETTKFSKKSMPPLITRIKIMSNMNIAEKRLPQDGRILMKIDGKEVDFRVSVLPTVNGEKIVIRILRRESYSLGKQKLGMSKEELKVLDNIIKHPHGIVLVTGPTGSGKSTTLYTILNDLNSQEENIITVEDPVEYMIKGINQVNVNVKSGLTFATGLRAILRQDPDIIMIGEIRDSETAQIAVRAAITGHLVLSTIHTNDASSSVIRLVDMGVQPYLVASSLCGVISQRLVRKICPRCKTSYIATNYEKQILGIDDKIKIQLYKGKGCGFCKGRGYSNRIGVYEMLEFTKEHKNLILMQCDSDAIRDLSIKKGMKTLKQRCIDLVLEGVTTIDELMKVAYF